MNVFFRISMVQFPKISTWHTSFEGKVVVRVETLEHRRDKIWTEEQVTGITQAYCFESQGLGNQENNWRGIMVILE